MFNKPALFPKTPEAPSSRVQRPGGGGSPLSAGVLSSSAAPGELSPQKDVLAQTLTDTADARAQAQSPVAEEQAGGSRLIVGPDVKLKGAEILDCDTLVVEGRVEATMDSRVIRVAENGAFAGTVGIDIAEIHGSFEGELTARQQLIIRATGRVSGKIRYGKIFIEEGGEISGDVQSLSAAAKEARKPAGPTIVETKPLAVAVG